MAAQRGGRLDRRIDCLGDFSSFLNGSGAVGGSLNFITRLASRDEDTFEGRVSYGRFDTTETSVGFNKALNTGDGPRHYARLDYSRTSTNGYIDRQENGAGNLAFSLLSDINEQLSHTLAIEYLEEKRNQPLLGHSGIAAIGRDPAHRQSYNRFNNNVEGGPLRTAHSVATLDHRLPLRRQYPTAQYLLSLQRPARLPQPPEVYRYNATTAPSLAGAATANVTTRR